MESHKQSGLGAPQRIKGDEPGGSSPSSRSEVRDLENLVAGSLRRRDLHLLHLGGHFALGSREPLID